MNKFQEIAEKLSCRKNWTSELIYVHRTRLVFGLAIGLILGFVAGSLCGRF